MKKIVFATTVLIVLLSLSACETVRSKPTPSVLPDVIEYSAEVQSAAADEMELPQCQTLSSVFMPDYKVMRDQTRAAKKLLK